MVEREEIIKYYKISVVVNYIFGIILHLLLLFAFVKDPLKRFKNVGTIFVINLAICDLMVCLLALLLIFKQDPKGWSSALDFPIPLSTSVSILTVVSISVDRFLLIVHPIKHRYWIKRKIIAIWLSCLWILGLSYPSKQFIFGYNQNYEDLVYSSIAVALLVLTSIVYGLLYVALKKQSRNMTERNESSQNRAEELRLLREKKFLKTIIFTACFTVAALVPGWILMRGLRNKVLLEDSLVYLILLCIFAFLHAINFAINPLIYIIHFPNYQKTFQILYCRR